MANAVLAGVTGSVLSDRVVERATAIARERGAALVIAHVVDLTFLQSLPGAAHTPSSAVHSLVQLGGRLLEKYEKGLEGSGLDVTAMVRRGQLFQELQEIINERGVDTLVVGKHKHHWLETHHGPDWERFRRRTNVELVVVD